MTPDDLLKKAIRRHEMERAKEAMSRDYNNDAAQAEKKAVLKNDTYFSRAQVTIGEEMGGRYRPLNKTVVEAVPQVPRQPETSPFHHDPTGPEPSLGYSVNDMVPTGNPTEVAASLQKTVPDSQPLKRRV